MNLHHTCSRRVLLQRSAIAGAAIIGTYASVRLHPRAALAQAEGTPYAVTVDGVRVRAMPSLSGTVLGFLNTGDVVSWLGTTPVEADGYVWLEIVVPSSGITGWTVRDFLDRAEAWPVGTEVRVNDNDVNLRSGPGLANSVIATHDAGTSAITLRAPTFANGFDWYQIEVEDGTTGWMVSIYLTPGSGTAAPGWVAGTLVHVNDNGVNLRTGPGLGNTVIATFNADTNARIIGGPQAADGYTWYDIGIGGTRGWMASDFLTEGQVGDPGFPDGAWVWTTTDLRLRSAPGLGGSIVATYGVQEAATVLTGPQVADGYHWYRVEMADDGNVGWMAGEFLDYAPTEPTGTRLRVADGPLNLRDNPDTSAAIITTIPTGGIVVIADASSVVNEGYTWRYVYVERDPDLVGWVAADFTAPA